MLGKVTTYIGEELGSRALPSAQKRVARRRGAAQGREKAMGPKEEVPTVSTLPPLPPYKVFTHSLKYEWVLWGLCDNAVRHHDWDKKLRELGRFNTVEEFWLLFDSVPAASSLVPSGDYFLFKRGVMPRWEDPANEHGGRWIATLAADLDNHLIDAYWMEVVKACVGAQFGAAGNEAVCGVAASVRTRMSSRVALWIRDARDMAQLGNVFEEKVNRVPSTSPPKLHFEFHPRKRSMQ